MNPSEKPQVRVGTGVLIIRDGKYLLGKRKGSHGAGTWCPPGGNLEFEEEPQAGAKRETKEEAGLDIDDLKFLGVTNDIFESSTHYITLWYQPDKILGEPKTMEPEKCEGWEWFDKDNLPSPLFTSTQNFFDGKIEKP